MIEAVAGSDASSNWTVCTNVDHNESNDYDWTSLQHYAWDTVYTGFKTSKTDMLSKFTDTRANGSHAEALLLGKSLRVVHGTMIRGNKGLLPSTTTHHETSVFNATLTHTHWRITIIAILFTIAVNINNISVIITVIVMMMMMVITIIITVIIIITTIIIIIIAIIGIVAVIVIIISSIIITIVISIIFISMIGLGLKS